MKQIKRFCKVIVFVMVLSILSPTALPLCNRSVAEAATVKLTKKTLSLEIGKTSTLKITGTKSKVTWSSSNKAIATVNTGGKITAKKEGKATITATVNKKKYNCTVTVTKPVNPFVKNAPFEAQETPMGQMNIVYPKDWTNQVIAEDGNNVIAMLYPSSADMESGTSNLIIKISETGNPQPDYTIVKDTVSAMYTEEAILAELSTQLGEGVTIANLIASDYKTTLGTAYLLNYDINYSIGDVVGTMHQSSYILFIDNYMFMLTATYIGDDLDIQTIGEYIINSIEMVK